VTDTTRTPTSTSSGVLSPDDLARHVHLERLPCSEQLAPWVENHWTLSWDLPDGVSYLSSTLPHPACNLSVERGHLREGVAGDPVVVTGVPTRRFDVTIRDQGWVFGTKFRPGGLASLAGVRARPLRDLTVPAVDVFPRTTVDALRELRPPLTPQACKDLVDAALSDLVTTPEPAYETVLGVVATMLEDRTLVRVAEVEERCGIDRRRLQRLFERYVGATPKWTLARYRIHDAVSDLDAGYAGSLADLAARYGWFDQAHFTREFTDLVGVPPSAYQRL
jgi:AraC-like DNA-binding protein